MTTVVGYLFGLPQNFFDSSVVPGEAAQEDASSQAGQQLTAVTAAPSTGRPAWRESGATCLTCGIGVGCPGFSSPQEQRQHFKSDWHRYNVKRRLGKQPAVSEEQFERVLEQGTEVSISGSDSESSSEDDLPEEEEGAAGGAGLQQPGADGAGSRAVRRRKNQQQAAGAIPRVTFQAADASLFAVWRCLLRQDHVKAAADQPTTPGELLGELRRLRAGCGTWMVVLLRGGHFAATVFKAREVRASSSAKQDAEALEGFDVVAHKTFHRYVVRAKAGGKQSSKDATGKFARSAGSRLRRYNEIALEREVQELLASWASHIAAADLIFAQAPSSNARSLFSEGQTTLLQSNPRLRRVPFVTHRPTFSETKRVLRLLCAVFRPDSVDQLLQAQHSSHAEEDAAAAAAAADALAGTHLRPAQQEGDAAQAAPGPGGVDAAAAAGPSAAAATAAAASLAGGSDQQQQPGLPDSPLHKAAKAGDPERVRRLLDSGHDPCARDAKGRTPYALAADKDTRDSFRRFMAQHPDRWDYSTSGIPSPLTDEMEAAQQSKKAAHKAKLKGKDPERKAGKAEGESGSAEERRRAAEADAEAARKQAVDDEIAQAVAEAAAISARLNASAKPSTSSGRAAGGSTSKVGGGGAGGGKAGKAPKGRGPSAAAAAQPAPAPTPEELARRREMMAAAAEARQRALMQASQQQKLW